MSTLRRIDIADGVWTQSGAVAKNGKVHLVPLSPLALEIIADVPANELTMDFLFTTTGTGTGTGTIKGYSHFKKVLDKVIGGKIIEPWTLHDLHRTAGTNMGRLGYDDFMVGRVLNHSAGRNRTTAIYNRYQYFEEKKRALAAWAAELRLIVDPEGGAEQIAGNVVPFPTAS